jgi:adenosylhomocysteinase
VLAQIELFTKPDEYENGSTCCPSTSTRRSRAAPREDRRQADQLTQEQADYIGVPVEGPYKPDHYRY